MHKDILFTVDLGEESSWREALPVAVEHARAFGSRLHVLTVVPGFGMSMVGQFFPEGYEEEVREKTNAELHAFVGAHVPEDIPVQHIVEEGTVYSCIVETAKRIGADLIVMQSHRPELSDYLLGPNAARVVRHAACSVLVVR